MRLKITPFRIGLCIAGFSLLLGSIAPGITPRSSPVTELYRAQLDSLDLALSEFYREAPGASDSQLADHFSGCRRLYKSLEYLIEYNYPAVAKKMNGPALPESEIGEPAELVLPTGFQVLEAEIFEGDPLSRELRIRQQLTTLRAVVKSLKMQSGSLAPDPSTTLDALKLNLYRMVSKGLAGYDAAVSHQSLSEAAQTIRATTAVLETLDLDDASIRTTAAACIAMLEADDVNFETFDYASFLSQKLNPLFAAMHKVQTTHHIPFATGIAAVRPGAVSFFASDAFDPEAFALESGAVSTRERAALGEKLFRDTRLSGGGRSCASCHKPEAFYADGLRVNTSLQREEGLQRNTPTLLNAALQPALFWDGRTRFLEEQAHDVIMNKDEMDGDASRIEAALSADPAYRKAFGKAFQKIRNPVTESNICVALAAYTRSLISMDAPFDRFMRGEADALTLQQRQGFNVFVGKANCASCHFMPVFNGAAPPDYTRAEGDVIGVPGDAGLDRPVPDADRGMYSLFKVRHLDGAFRTPTLRHTAKTAPYMHNGVFRTLEEVVEFYDRGGGVGLGLNIPTQTLSSEPLKLSKGEKAALVAFLRAL